MRASRDSGGVGCGGVGITVFDLRDHGKDAKLVLALGRSLDDSTS